MIKNATGMNAAEYVDFVKKNPKRSFGEIVPAEYRVKIYHYAGTNKLFR